MLAIIKVIYVKNTQNELIALQMSGISKNKLSTPLFFIALILTCISYANYEFLTPKSVESIESFKNEYFRENKKNIDKSLNILLLENKTKLIYQKYDPIKNQLFDVFWINSANDIWHIKYLRVDAKTPLGTYVDHFLRDKEGRLIKQESFDSYNFAKIQFDKDVNSSLKPYNTRPISMLYSQYKNKRYSSVKEKAYILSQLNYKLAMPLLPFLIVLSLLPICMRFSRISLIYLISFISLISFIAFYIMMDAAMILSENQIGSSFWIIWSPIIITFFFFSFKFIKN
jgi:lipopolysaccharide export system permease protein